MKKKFFLLAVYILLSSVLPGCWDYTEYESMAQLIGMGIDYDAESQETTIIVQYPSIKRGKGGATGGAETTPEWIVHAATDKTIFGALTKLQEIIPQRLFYGYIKVLVVGENAAQNNILDMIDLFDRTPVMRSSAYVVITSGKAEDVIKTDDPTHVASCEEIHKLIQQGKNSGTSHAVTLSEFTQMLAIGGWEASAPRVIRTTAKASKEEKDTKGGNEGKDDKGGAQKSQAPGETQDKDAKGGTQGNIRFHIEEQGALRIVGMAVFQGSTLTGWLDERETMGFNWIKGRNIHAYKVSEPAGGAGVEELYFRIVETKGKIKVHMENDQPVISVNVKIVGDLRKYYRNEGSDFLLAEEIRAMEKKLSDSIRSDIDAALIRGQQELRSDIFGFGFAFFRTDPKLWQKEFEAKWADIYPDIPVYVNIDAKVINTGINERKLYIK